MSLFDELKRRNVFKVGAAYLVVGWVIIEVASTVAPQLNLPEWAPRLITFIIMLGFPIALVLAWIFDMTPEGVRVTEGRTGSTRFYAVVGVFVVAAMAWFLYKPVDQSAIPVAGAPSSLAVLPFAVLSQDPDTVGLAGGLHDTLITQLSRLHGLEVRSRTSVMRYQDWTGGLRMIAEELGVSVILEGSVQRLGNRTVVNAQLIDARSDAHIWAETFDLTNDDLFALQAEIAQRVAAALQVALTPSERSTLTTAPTEDSEAYALYLQGLRFLYAGENLPEVQREENHARAVEVFEAAVARDPEFALAWAMLARTYATRAWGSALVDYREMSTLARRAAEEAVALGSDLAEARYARGIVALQLDFDFERAAREIRAAIEGMPSSAEMHSRLGLTLIYLRRWDDGVAAARRAHELDPTSISLMRGLRETLMGRQAWGEIRELSRRVATMNPGSYDDARLSPEIESMLAGDLAPMAVFLRGAVDGFRPNPTLTEDRMLLAASQGNWGEAVSIIDAAGPDAQPDEAGLTRAWALLHAGRDEEARVALEGVRDWLQGRLLDDRDPYVEAMMRAALARIQANLGEAGDARRNIARADAIWGYQREPADGGRVAREIAVAHLALGEFDAAVAQLRPLVERPSYFPAQRLWLMADLAPLHRHAPFLALMRAHGVDVTRSPFAAMLAVGGD
jgi:TolB-like protein